MCTAVKSGGFGCIGADTLKDRSNFECPVCITANSNVETGIIPYYIAGSGLRRIPKIAWPVVLIGLQLLNIDSIAIKVLEFIMKNHYSPNEQNVSVMILAPHTHADISMA